MSWKDYPCKPYSGFKHSSGYGWCTYKDKTQKAHKAEWQRHHGPIPRGMHVLHHCDNPPCVEIHHLFLGTHEDNMKDMVKKGRSAHRPGETNPNARLSDDDVATIRQLHALGMTRRSLANQFKISPSWVGQLVTGRKRP